MWTTVQKYIAVEDSARRKAEQESNHSKSAREPEPRERGKSAFVRLNKGRLEPKVDESHLTPLMKSRTDILSLNKDVLRPPPPLQAPMH